MTGIHRMLGEEYAMMAATQAMYMKISNFCQISHKIIKTLLLVSEGKTCKVIEMGPNLFTGNLVMAWTKDLPHGHILNF